MVAHDPVALRDLCFLLGAAGAFGCWWLYRAWLLPRIRRGERPRWYPFESENVPAAFVGAAGGVGLWASLMSALGGAIASVIVVASAAYGVHSEYKARREKASRSVSAAAQSKRSAATALIAAIRAFCKTILDFVAEREALNPGANLPHPLGPRDPQFTAATSAEFRRIQADADRYAAQTLSAFNSRFATDARRYYTQLRDEYGLVDANLDANISFPMNTHVMTWIANELGALSARLEEGLKKPDTILSLEHGGQKLYEDLERFLNYREVSHPNSGLLRAYEAAKKKGDPLQIQVLGMTISSTMVPFGEAQRHEEETWSIYCETFLDRVNMTITALQNKNGLPSDKEIDDLMARSMKRPASLRRIAEYLHALAGGESGG